MKLEYFELQKCFSHTNYIPSWAINATIKWVKVIKHPNITCKRNFHEVPTSTPGTGPKWFSGTMVQVFCLAAQANPLPQSRDDWDLAERITDFFLLSFNISPAFTISVSSFLHRGQYLEMQNLRLPVEICLISNFQLGLRSRNERWEGQVDIP